MKYELLDQDLNSCGFASMDEILQLRSECHRRCDAGEDYSQRGPEYYRLSPHYQVPIISAVPVVVSIALIADSAFRAYDSVLRGFEYMPEPVSSYRSWAKLFQLSNELAFEACCVAGVSRSYSSESGPPTFRNRTALIETLERLSAAPLDSSVYYALRDYVDALRNGT